MPPKPSTANSRRTRPQKYQNTHAYQHNKKSKLTQKILESPITGLCARCHDIVEWRKRYRKYKPLTVPKKCVGCSQKRITEAYHILCNPCAKEKKVCAKCQESKEIASQPVKTTADLIKEQQETEALLKSMTERQRRSYLRKMDREDFEGADKLLRLAAAHAGSSDNDWDWDESDNESDNEEEDDDDEQGQEPNESDSDSEESEDHTEAAEADTAKEDDQEEEEATLESTINRLEITSLGR